MRRLVLLFILLLFPVSVWAQTSVSTDRSAEKKAVYFYQETCEHCQKVNAYFESQGIYGKYDIEKIETSGAVNIALLNKFFDAFNIPADKRGFPVIFFGDKVIIGDQPIINGFVKGIDQTDASQFPTPDSIRNDLKNENVAAQSKKAPVPTSLIISAIGAALVDAINPCALAVLILLLATVIAAKGKNQALMSGLLFAFAVFLSYFMMGLGVYRAITVFRLPTYISLAVAVLAIMVGLANLKDVFWYGKGFIMEVPLSWRPKMQAVLKSVANPIGAFGAGFLISLFLVPCASGPYVVILGLLADKVSPAKTILLLILYNLVFVLPMIVITVAMYFGSRMGTMETWRKKNIKILHAITGTVMLFMGVYLIYGWLK